MSDPTPTQARTGMRPALRVLLFVSLALNLLIAGLVAGAIGSGRVGDRPRLNFDLGPFVRALGPEDRRAILDEVRSDPDFRPPSPRQRRQDLVHITQILRTEPFDAAAMEQVLADQRERGQRIVAGAHRALVARMAELPAAERSAFADRLEAESRRGPPDRESPREGRD